MPRKVNMIFVGYPSDLGGGGGLDRLRPLGPPRPLGYFGLPTVNPRKPPFTTK
jgi:hypothetical protein